MLICPRSCFLHIPKTGGSWVTSAIAAGGIPSQPFLIDGDDPHGELRHCPRSDLFRFAFVRHPEEYYGSFWRYKMTVGWDFRNELEVRCHSTDFNVFVRNVLQAYPGWCSGMFEDYVGLPENEIEFVGRQERLADDLVRALRAAGETFDEGALRACPPENVTDRTSLVAKLTPDLREALHASERRAIVRFGYPVR